MAAVAHHYVSIGFLAPDPMEVVDLLRRAISEGSRESGEDGTCFIRLHDDASGARINVVLERSGVVRSAKPSFAPSRPRRIRARIAGLHPDAVNADADLVQLTPLGGDYPLAVEFENGSRATSQLSFGEEADVELVGFAGRLDCFADAGAYLAAAIPLGIGEVVPAGLYALATAQDPSSPGSAALASGVVVKCNRLRNALSGRDFLHLVVETAAMTLDVVVAPEAVQGPPPQPGCIVTGALWFVARLAEPVGVAAAPMAAAIASVERQAVTGAGPSAFMTTALCLGPPVRPRLFSRWY